jgi:hypothetical protein
VGGPSRRSLLPHRLSRLGRSSCRPDRYIVAPEDAHTSLPPWVAIRRRDVGAVSALCHFSALGWPRAPGAQWDRAAVYEVDLGVENQDLEIGRGLGTPVFEVARGRENYRSRIRPRSWELPLFPPSHVGLREAQRQELSAVRLGVQQKSPFERRSPCPAAITRAARCTSRPT